MKIVILDSETVSRNDVSLDEIKALGETEIYGYTKNEDVAQRIGDADAVICNKCLITDEVFESCKNLKYVGLFATGYNNVDTLSATRHGAVVCNVPSYSTNSVAQHVFAFLLNYFNRVSEYDATVKNGDWVNYKLFSYFYIPIQEISGMTMGIIGFGDIGKKVSEIARAFGMRVVAYSRTPEKITSAGVESVTLDELLAQSDVVTLHCPLNENTKELINKDTLGKMKPSAVLINTSRGGVVNENDLALALRNKTIAHACVDVITYEPMREDCPLRGIENCTITPHIAWAPKKTRERLISVVAENIRCYKNGKPQNVVNKGVN